MQEAGKARLCSAAIRIEDGTVTHCDVWFGDGGSDKKTGGRAEDSAQSELQQVALTMSTVHA